MPIRRWLRNLRKPERRSAPGGHLIRSALDGAGLDHLIEMAARELVLAADADRAGLWLAAESGDDWTGMAVDAHRPAPRREWQRLGAESPLLERLLRDAPPVVIDLQQEPELQAGLLRPMRTAVSFPLVAEGKPFGVLLLGYAVTRARRDLASLRPAVEEAVVALAYGRARERSLRAGQLMQEHHGHTEKLAALGQVVSGIAHELNNPLTSIMGYAQLLLSRPGDPAREANTRLVYQEAERARRIVQNLLVFARESKPERRFLDLNEIVERTIALRSYELKIENISLDPQLAQDLPPVSGDAHQLQQVVLNLLVNAEQAILQSRPEEPELRGAGQIRVRTGRNRDGRLFLEVSDNGPGVPPAVASRIFDPFFTTKPLGQGTGLGLSIAYGTVQEHGGEIYLAPERPAGFSSGASFVVELPAHSGQERASPARIGAELPRAAGRIRRVHPARVLVVEDEPTVAQLVADVLADEGHQVEFVLDSREGLARALRSPFDLIICDLRMPRLDGRAFYEEMVRAGSAAQDRLVFITGDTLGARTLEFLDAHRLPYLGKPFLVEELKAVVNHALQRASPQDGTTSFARGDAAASDRTAPPVGRRA